jgi:hypothetical protein
MELWQVLLIGAAASWYILLGLLVKRHASYKILKRGFNTREEKWLSRRPWLMYALLAFTSPVVIVVVVLWLLLQAVAYTAYGAWKVLSFVGRRWRRWIPGLPAYVLVALIVSALLIGGRVGEALMAAGFVLTMIFATLGLVGTMLFIDRKVAKRTKQ